RFLETTINRVCDSQSCCESFSLFAVIGIAQRRPARCRHVLPANLLAAPDSVPVARAASSHQMRLVTFWDQSKPEARCGSILCGRKTPGRFSRRIHGAQFLQMPDS